MSCYDLKVISFCGWLLGTISNVSHVSSRTFVLCNGTFKTSLGPTIFFHPYFPRTFLKTSLHQGRYCTQVQLSDKCLCSDDIVDQTWATNSKWPTHQKSPQIEKLFFVTFYMILRSFANSIAWEFILGSLEQLHIITDYWCRSSVSTGPIQSRGVKERVTHWPALTERVNHVFINTLWCGPLWYNLLSMLLSAVTHNPVLAAGEDYEECCCLTCCE